MNGDSVCNSRIFYSELGKKLGNNLLKDLIDSFHENQTFYNMKASSDLASMWI